MKRVFVAAAIAVALSGLRLPAAAQTQPETFLDSPLLTARNFRKIVLDRSNGSAELDLAADEPEDLAAGDDTVAEFRQLVHQADLEFGARHWRNYHFLVAVSDAIDYNGIEHHESSDGRAPRTAFYADLDVTSGRRTRPLIDTATQAGWLYFGTPQFARARRLTDFYPEGTLVWLEADAMVRGRSNGAKSLDDFVRAFLGPPGGAPTVVTYTGADVVAALNAIAPYDWETFFRTRIDDTTPHPLIDGSPAAAAGLAPYMHVLAVGGRRYSAEALHAVLRSTLTSNAPIPVVVDDFGAVSTLSIVYRGGERYPRLVPIPGKPDLLTPIAQPRKG
jgi:predicted metalloprotease with PDZ domain